MLTKIWTLLLWIFYLPTCFLRMCDDSEIVGPFVEYPDGNIYGVYRTKCPKCGRNYVRNTDDPYGGKQIFDKTWEGYWSKRRTRN